jgi:copper resistance protein C
MFKTTLARLASAVLALWAGQAFAHAHLQTSLPAANAAVAKAPVELDLSFSERLILKFSGVTITGPDKNAIAPGEAALTKDGTGLTVPLPQPLEPGSYTVNWHAFSADGHKTQGSYSFTVKP